MKKEPGTFVSPEYIGRDDAAALISVSVQTIDKWHRNGLLEFHKPPGRRVLISRRELLALVESGIC
jgi:excisionase family DNA binding protein